MKTYLLLILLISSALQSQTNFSQTTGNQLDYFNSNANELKGENGSISDMLAEPDSLQLTGEAQSKFGNSVSNAGDVNGDGYSDVIVGSYQYNGYTGRAYVFYGGPSMNNTADVTMTGEAQLNLFAQSVSSAGDVNGDGYSDVIVGVPINGNVGRAYIYFGGIVMDNTVDIFLPGVSSYDNFGYSVSTAGDVNGDGFDDVIVGAHYNSSQAGSAFIFYGGSTMNNVADIIMTGGAGSHHFGISVSTAGDVNGDEFDDVIVGAQYNITSRSYIYYGGASMDNTADIILTSESANSNFGISVSTGGDVNGDGYSDVIVGVYGYSGSGNSYKGRAFIYYGGSTMNNESDLFIPGETTYDQFGYSVSTAGDVNRDGYSDVIVGANGYYYTTGRAYIFYGGVNMDSLADVILTGQTQNNNFGNSVSSVGDVNADGFSDVIVGAEGSNRAYVYITNPDIIKINMKVLMEGMYYPLFNQMSRKDTVLVYLRETTSPYAIRDSSKAVIDSISFSGLFKFINAPTGTYYIVVKHFNCIETWSKAGGEQLVNDGSIYNYDFTSSSSQTYGNNVKLKGTKYCMFSGDVNQDGIIDIADYLIIDNDNYNFRTGLRIPADLNGDNVVDLTDMQIADNNHHYIQIISPLNSLRPQSLNMKKN